MDSKFIPIKIKEYRNSKGLTQEALAELASVPCPTLIKIENGMSKNPTINTLIKICTALKIDISSILRN
ncbi:MAG: helix-turn-helix domain-containing protein [Candidatus Dojkabacteria bacterium]